MLLSRPIARRLGSSVAAFSVPLTRPRLQLASRPHHPCLAGSLAGPPLAARRGFITASVQVTQDLITGLHAVTGTPWFLTIPLVALTVCLARLPLQLYSLHIGQLQARAAKLFTVAAHNEARETKLSRPELPRDEFTKVARKRILKARALILRRLGAQTWKLYYAPLVTMPLWLLVSETLRRMSGGGFGLLGILSSKIWGTEASSAPAGLSASATASPVAADAASSAANAVSSAATSSIEAVSALSDATASVVSTVEMSLATGGCLWFPSLMEPDPYHILPFLYSAVLIRGILAGSKAKSKQEDQSKLVDNGTNAQPAVPAGPSSKVSMDISSYSSQVWKRTLTVFALAVGPATMGLPSAIHLYWLSSSVITQTLSALAQRGQPKALPDSGSVTPCKGVSTKLVFPRPKPKINQFSRSKSPA